MKTPLALALILLGISTGSAFAMTDETTHYQGTDQKAQVTDPDERNEFSGSPATGAPSGREQYLLGNGQTGDQSTYNMQGGNGPFSFGFSQGVTTGSGMYTRRGY